VSDWRVPGFTSTASLRPDALFGAAAAGEDAGLPTRMERASGCRVWDAEGREYVDYVMALGAVALGYGHPEVNRAAERAIETDRQHGRTPNHAHVGMLSL